jgi:hypothetical protein
MGTMGFTDEDRQWINELLDRKLERFATREDLQHFATREDLQHFATREDLEGVETRLLTEFHRWASGFETRQRSHSAVLRALDVQAELFEDRLKKLEGRDDTP